MGLSPGRVDLDFLVPLSDPLSGFTGYRSYRSRGGMIPSRMKLL